MKIQISFLVFISTFGLSLAHTFMDDNMTHLSGCCVQKFGKNNKGPCIEKATKELRNSYVDKKYAEDLTTKDVTEVISTMERYITTACNKAYDNFGREVTTEQFGFLLSIGLGSWVEEDNGSLYSKLKDNITRNEMNEAMKLGASYWQRLCDKNFDFLRHYSDVILERTFLTFYEDYTKILKEGKINKACTFEKLLLTYNTCCRNSSSMGKIEDIGLRLLKERCNERNDDLLDDE